MEEDLQKEKQELQSKLVALEQRRKQITDKETVLREKMLKYEKIIQDIDNRRERAIIIAQEENEQLLNKDNEIKMYKENLIEIQKEKEDIQAKQKDSKIHQFLESVLEVSNGELKQIKDVVLKYESLQNTLQNLREKHGEKQKIIAEEKKAIYEYTHNQRENILVLNENIAKLKLGIAKAEEEINKLKVDLDWDVQDETMKRLIYEEMKLAISNMVSMVTSHCGRQIRSEDPIHQIEKVQQYIDDLKYIAEVGRCESVASDMAQATSSVGN